MRTVVSVVPDNLPIKKNVFHLRTAPDIVYHHVISVFATRIDNNTDVGNPAS